MQFIPSTWRTYGIDANKDGKKDPYNPVDAIFAAARYLKAAGYEKDVRRAIFAYNHADWYVDSVMLRARLIAGVPADLVGSLTGLTEGRFPVSARARYADDLPEARGAQARQARPERRQRGRVRGRPPLDRDLRPAGLPGRRGQRRRDQEDRRQREARPLRRAPGRVRQPLHLLAASARSRKYYPVPKEDATDPKRAAQAVKANGDADDPKPTAPGSAGRQPDLDDSDREPAQGKPSPRRPAGHRSRSRSACSPTRTCPARARPAASSSCSTRRRASRAASRPTATTSRARSALDAKDVRLRRLQGRLARDRRHDPRPRRPHRAGQGRRTWTSRSARPAGARRGSTRSRSSTAGSCSRRPRSTAPRAATCSTATTSDGFSIGQILLLPKPLLEKRVLSDERIEIYDVRPRRHPAPARSTGACWPRSPTSPSPACSPTVTEPQVRPRLLHAARATSPTTRSGNAVDIAKINGIPILGHQEPGGITEQAVRRLMRLQGTMAPDQIISLLELGGATLAMGDHADHIHVGFRPLFGANKKLGKQALAVLKPGQWSDLLERLRKIENPVVPTKPSKYALPAKKPSAPATPTAASSSTAAAAVRLRPARVRLPARARRRALPGARRARRPSRGACWCWARSARRSAGCCGRARPRASSEAEPEPVPTVAGHGGPAGAVRLRRARRRPGSTALRGDDERARRRAATARCAVLNRALRAHRAARGRPLRARRVAPTGRSWCGSATAPATRWPTAASPRRWELPRPGAATAKRSMEAPEERFAALLGGREQPLVARSWCCAPAPTSTPGRPREAALQARVALEALLAERGALAEHRGAVGDAANAALLGELDAADAAGADGSGKGDGGRAAAASPAAAEGGPIRLRTERAQASPVRGASAAARPLHRRCLRVAPPQAPGRPPHRRARTRAASRALSQAQRSATP